MQQSSPSLSDLALRQLRAHRASQTKRRPGFTWGGAVKNPSRQTQTKITLRRADYERGKEERK